MSQPVSLSDEILLDAERTAAAADRSLADQIELWAHLGRAIEPLLEGARILELRRSGGVQRLSECLASVDTEEGRKAVAAYLDSRPYPHYTPAAGAPDCMVRTDRDGVQVVGRFVDGEFRACE